MSFFKKVQEGAAKAAEKAKETVEITRFSAQISSKKKDIEKLKQSIGESVFQSFLVNDFGSAESSVVSICNQIADLYKEIAAIELKIKEVKNEKDCVCGATVSTETSFCPSCGHKFEAAKNEKVIDIEVARVALEDAPVLVSVSTCPGCKATLEPSALFCGTCGISVNTSS